MTLVNINRSTYAWWQSVDGESPDWEKLERLRDSCSSKASLDFFPWKYVAVPLEPQEVARRHAMRRRIWRRRLRA